MNENTESLLLHLIEAAERLDWPAVEIPPSSTISPAGDAPPVTTVGPGRDAWAGWSAAADRRQLARALGVLVARYHRTSTT
jgi:hypothetical protein